MQYLLTEEEYQALSSASKGAADTAKQTIIDLCIRVANSEPVKLSKDDRRFMNKSWAEAISGKPWGCWLTSKDGKPDDNWYCDNCPVRKICPAPHHYSK